MKILTLHLWAAYLIVHTFVFNSKHVSAYHSSRSLTPDPSPLLSFPHAVGCDFVGLNPNRPMENHKILLSHIYPDFVKM